ncbi:MAG: DUF3486 family protein [Azoarcus sp.]|jgi:lysozyme|nr:DUF3486 family protein [Azoarcus sp.]
MANNLAARIAAAGLALSAAGMITYFGYEGWADTAAPPVPGDVPTYGFGTTRDASGKPLKGGERITPQQGVKLALRDVTVTETALKRCLDGIYLHPHEYDAFMSLALNVGPAAVCNSSIPGKLRDNNYAAACMAILSFDRFCTKPKVKRVCPPGALKTLQTELFEAILSLQEADDPSLDPGERVGMLSAAAKNIATLTRSSVSLKEFQAKAEERARRELLAEQKERLDELGRSGTVPVDVLAKVMKAAYDL